MTVDLKRLCNKIDYQFTNQSLLTAALTHCSVRGANNERLEFLGDSIVNFLIAEVLYRAYPQAREGELSRLRASLVKGDTLAEIAREFDLGSYLRLGSGELKSGGFRRASILADAIEALIAAIYLDSDLATCREKVLVWYHSRLQQLPAHADLKDPKTRLQEYLQGKRIDLPHYEVISISGEPHAQTFVVECVVHQLNSKAQGTGSSRRKAEQQAANNLLNQIEKS